MLLRYSYRMGSRSYMKQNKRLANIAFKTLLFIAVSMGLLACGGGGGGGGGAVTYSLGGTVIGLASGSQVVLANGTDTVTVGANGAFSFPQTLSANGAYAVTTITQPAGAICTVANGTGSGVISDVNSIQVTCSSTTFTIAGTVSGLSSGQQVTLQNNSGNATTITTNGAFNFSTPVAFNGSYAVTVGTQPSGQTCSVSNGTGSGVTANISNVAVTCSTNTFTVAGTVSGLATGQQVTLQNNGTNPVTVTANGSFSFSTPVAFNGSYAVTVGTQPSGQTCSVSNGSGSGVTANVSNVQVTCSTNTFTVAGTVSGLISGRQVTLQNSGANPVTVSSNGSFSFSTPVAYNSSYAVTVGTQPTGQTCSVSNGTGSGVTANISNVQVTCSVSCNTTLSGILATNTVYGIAGSPYCINGSLQVPSGISVSFDPGTLISGGSIIVGGLININGTVSNMVTLNNVNINPAGSLSSNHSINISGANISGGSIYAATGNAIYGNFNLTDSIISGVPYIYLWYPLGDNLIARNKFLNSGGISFGLDFRNYNGILSSLSIVNNYFSSWTTAYALSNWANYGSGSALIEKNTFNVVGGYVALLPAGYSGTVLNMPNNYWGTTNTSTILSYIYDQHNDITSGGLVTYLPILSVPDSNTPSN